MDWKGIWTNQYGSAVEITDDADGRIEGYFRTALEDSGFFGQNAPILGVAKGNCINFAAAGTGPKGDMVVSYTGLLRDGKMETLWYYAGDREPGDSGTKEVPWWRAMIANADTFSRTSR